MGYTNYWTRTTKPITNEFLTEVENIINEFRNKGVSICDGRGYGTPIIEEDRVIFNGNAQKDTDCESFCLLNDPDTLDEWTFCKTNEKPYDAVVKAVLEIAEKMGLVIGVHDDGAVEFLTDDEWCDMYCLPFK